MDTVALGEAGESRNVGRIVARTVERLVAGRGGTPRRELEEEGEKERGNAGEGQENEKSGDHVQK